MNNNDFYFNKAMRFAKACGANITISNEIPYAGVYYYDKDLIIINKQIIEKEDFDPEHVIFHELAHWTGHKSRLNRIRYLCFFGLKWTIGVDKEECIADLIFLILAQQYLLNDSEYDYDKDMIKEAINEHCLRYKKFKYYEEAVKQSKEAVDYLINLVNKNESMIG